MSAVPRKLYVVRVRARNTRKWSTYGAYTSRREAERHECDMLDSRFADVVVLTAYKLTGLDVDKGGTVTTARMRKSKGGKW